MPSPIETLHEYYRVFSTLKIGDIVAYFSEPCMIVSSRGTFSSDRTGVGEAFAPMIEGLRAKGYQSSEFAEPEVTMLTDTAAMIRGVVVRHMTASLDKFPISYVMHRSESGWKIAVLVLGSGASGLAADTAP